MQVIKLGNRIFEHTLSDNGLEDFEHVYRETPTLLVHGGGDTVTEIAERLGVPQNFVTSPEGFRSRQTDWDTVQVYTMVIAGKVNKDIVLRLQKRKIPAVGVSGLDGAFIKAERKRKLIATDTRGRRRLVEGGYTGRITGIDRSLPDSLLKANFLPIVAPIAISEEFEPLNIDGDRTAAHLAGAFHADLLLLMTDVPGLLIDNELVTQMDTSEAKENLSKIGPGMITKVYAALEAISMGAKKVVIAPGNGPSPFTSAITGKTGTTIEPS